MSETELQELQGSERRKFKRIKKQFTARVRMYGDPLSHDWNIVVIRNLSAGGAAFVYDREVPSGTLMNFKINFGNTKEPIQCFGKVLRAKSISASFYELATIFTEMDKKDHAMISHSADEFCARKAVRMESRI